MYLNAGSISVIIIKTHLQQSQKNMIKRGTKSIEISYQGKQLKRKIPEDLSIDALHLKAKAWFQVPASESVTLLQDNRQLDTSKRVSDDPNFFKRPITLSVH